MIKFDNTMRHEYTEKNSPKSEVTQFVYFDDGEGAMLTKQYYAYVMNLDEKEVVQKRVELLKMVTIFYFLIVTKIRVILLTTF